MVFLILLHEIQSYKIWRLQLSKIALSQSSDITDHESRHFSNYFQEVLNRRTELLKEVHDSQYDTYPKNSALISACQSLLETSYVHTIEQSVQPIRLHAPFSILTMYWTSRLDDCLEVSCKRCLSTMLSWEIRTYYFSMNQQQDLMSLRNSDSIHCWIIYTKSMLSP